MSDQFESLSNYVVNNLTKEQDIAQRITDPTKAKNPYNKFAWIDLREKNKKIIEG